ncbi:S-layer homology domain-containing protein [Candidatus Gracilibacteria bacterium]|nr:S-layer homology domain-containing protein [Candidatus Gracilibacteria bacterium]
MNIIGKISFLFGLMVPVSSFAFSDISAQDPQFHIFSHLQETKIINGYGDGNFYPERTVTRAEALIIALRAGDIVIQKEFSGKTYFSDIDPNQWYAPAISRGVETGIIFNKNKTFNPNNPVTKAEFLAFLFRSTKVDFTHHFGNRNIALDIPNEAWFVPHFSYAKKYQIAQIPADKFYRPFKKLSRREVAMMTFRQLKIFHGTPATKLLAELQAEIQQFLTLSREKKISEAEFHLHKILDLNDKLTRTKNNSNAVAARFISRSMKNLSESLRYFRREKTLLGIEYLYIALKQAKKANEKSSEITPFAKELVNLINETLISFTTPTVQQLSQR